MKNRQNVDFLFSVRVKSKNSPTKYFYTFHSQFGFAIVRFISDMS
ncbi:hypothetical protein PROVRUST_06016 [Providencia rustigianii DSM 4541]|uniref:Uncharacterized protein n=1 Tax=Providencia rustigianii DSM 4541 TaxID=500637 RepID=D1P1E8_9GAMM|nr:hypothetical protein PROVRUST_06016 [Providencia rustigianii DSM 4541]